MLDKTNGPSHPAFESAIRTIENAAPGKEALVFQNMAREVFNAARIAGISEDDAITRLLMVAISLHLVSIHGEAAVTRWIAEGQQPPEMPTKPEVGLEVVCMADVKAKPIEWLWQDWVAIGKVSVLAGEGGVGKSTILCDLAARTTRGQQWPDGGPATDSGSVIILAAEDDVEDTLAPRLLAAGADMSRVFNIRSVRGDNLLRRSFSLQADLERLEDEIEKRGNVRLVIIDPVSSYLGRGIDSHKNSEVRSVLEPLGEMASRKGVAVICNNHFSKGGGTANSRIIGSVAFVNQARSAFIVTKDKENEGRLLLIPSKTNIAPLKFGLAYRIEGLTVTEGCTDIETSRINWEDSPVTITADEATAPRGIGYESKSGKAEAMEFLKEILAGGSRPASEVKAHAHEAGITDKMLRTAREALGLDVTKGGMSEGWIWALPKVPT